MRQKILLATALALLCGPILLGAGQAQTSDNYALEWLTMGSGGGQMDSTNYMLDGTSGQALASCAESTHYALAEGCGGPRLLYVYLPLVIKAHP